MNLRLIWLRWNTNHVQRRMQEAARDVQTAYEILTYWQARYQEEADRLCKAQQAAPAKVLLRRRV